MKTFLFSFTIFLGAFTPLSATVLTVNNTGGGQYSSLLTALQAASNGDTLMVQGTIANYNADDGSSGWNKNLVVIGTGYNSPKEAFYKTTITIASAYNLSGTFAISYSGGSKFYGITFYNPVHLNTNCTNLVFENCVFEDRVSTIGNNVSHTLSNSLFKNCIFKNISQPSITTWGTISNTVFSHCIFAGTIENLNLTTTLEHCVLMKNTGDFFAGVSSIQINNSIFYGNGAINSIVNSAFNNCISLNTTTGWSSNGNTANNCLDNTNPLFVNVPVGSTFSTALNFNLQSGSACVGAASDGTDIGLFGGVEHFSYSGEPFDFPVVRKVTIQNTSVPQNGNVNVKVRSTKARTN
jgi:hypothetical protein